MCQTVPAIAECQPLRALLAAGKICGFMAQQRAGDGVAGSYGNGDGVVAAARAPVACLNAPREGSGSVRWHGVDIDQDIAAVVSGDDTDTRRRTHQICDLTGAVELGVAPVGDLKLELDTSRRWSLVGSRCDDRDALAPVDEPALQAVDDGGHVAAVVDRRDERAYRDVDDHVAWQLVLWRALQRLPLDDPFTTRQCRAEGADSEEHGQASTRQHELRCLARKVGA